MASAVYPAKAALKALLEAYTWPVSAPQISWGQPTEQEDRGIGADETVYLAETQVANDFVTLGGNRLDQTFALRVVIDVRRYGDDEQATEQRAWTLRDAIVQLARSNSTLSGTINRVTGFRIANTNAPGPSQWRCQIIVDVQCVAYEVLS